MNLDSQRLRDLVSRYSQAKLVGEPLILSDVDAAHLSACADRIDKLDEHFDIPVISPGDYASDVIDKLARASVALENLKTIRCPISEASYWIDAGYRLGASEGMLWLNAERSNIIESPFPERFTKAAARERNTQAAATHRPSNIADISKIDLDDLGL